MAVAVDIKALLEAGVHFGHKTSRWHPKMAPYIHSKRQDSHIIDLTKTVEGLEKALPVITKTVAGGKQVLFVGTKKQAKDIVKAAAEKAGQPYVTERWVGGMLTNVATNSTCLPPATVLVITGSAFSRPSTVFVRSMIWLS
jgi:small subunit ribosomal protein S2